MKKRQKRGRPGGLKGGPARAKALSPKRRRDIARKAARKRWGNRLEAMLKELQSR